MYGDNSNTPVMTQCHMYSYRNLDDTSATAVTCTQNCMNLENSSTTALIQQYTPVGGQKDYLTVCKLLVLQLERPSVSLPPFSEQWLGAVGVEQGPG
jgi:hypothetical protein